MPNDQRDGKEKRTKKVAAGRTQKSWAAKQSKDGGKQNQATVPNVKNDEKKRDES